MIKKLMIALVITIWASFAQTNGILREYWLNISGSGISSLISSTSFPCNPSGSTIESSFKAPINWSDNYGTRMRGFITAPNTGNYVFWICGDDVCELWLSTDENTANKRRIAMTLGYTGDLEWTKYGEQRSVNIQLEAGKRYYIEALHKEETLNDHITVRWQLPNGTIEQPIGSNRLTPWPIQENYSSWSYSTQVIFNTTSSGVPISNDVVNFPLLIKLNSSNSSIFNQSKVDGADLRFADPDGTQLSFEIESWNRTLMSAAIWVKVPRITANSTQDKIIMYWGKSDAVPKSDAGAVFNYLNGYSNIWHLNDNTSSNVIKDATGHFDGSLQNNSSNENTSIRHVDGTIGGALDFTGYDRIAFFNYTPVQNYSEFTISAWVNADQLNNYRGIWFTPEWGSYGKVRIYGTNNWVYENGTGTQITEVTSPSTMNQWIQLTATQKTNGNVEFYVNGISCGTRSYTNKGPHGGNSFIGSEELSNYFDGKIDEVTFSTVSRSNDWIKLTYGNQKSGQILYTLNSSNIAAPSDVIAVCNGTTVNLNWKDNANNETGYTINKRAGISPPVYVETVPANVTNYLDEIGTCGQNITYMIKAINSTSESDYIESNEIYTIPCMPSDFKAEKTGESNIKLTWTGNAPDYIIEGTTSLLPGAVYEELYNGTSQQFIHQGAQCNVEWIYRLKAVNPAGSSGWETVNITTDPCPINTPANLTADNSIPGKITLFWNDISDNEDGFKIYRKKEGESDFQIVGSTSGSLGEEKSYSDETVLCNTNYSYYVIAYNSTNESGASSTVTTKTMSCGSGKTTENMVSINGMYLNTLGNPVTGKRLAIVKLYNSENVIGTPIYEESFTDIDVKNGYFNIPLGLTEDVATVIRNHENIYYDVIIDGISMNNSKGQPLTSSPYSIKNSFNLAGSGSPINIGIAAPIGATFVDTTNILLYVKYGSNDIEWKRVGN